jgi:alkylhydroperoxidase family enzyme
MRAHTASAKRIGITDEQIHALLFYHRSPLFDEKEKAVIHFADQVTRAAATIRDSHLQELRKHFSEEQIIELALTTSVANFTNRVNDSLISSPDLGT